MGAEHKEAKHLEIVFLADLPHGEEIAQGFGHFAVVNIQEGIVHPISGKFLAIAGLALGDLIFMMGEHQILAAGMDVNLLTQVFFGHNGALNMPARTSLSPGGLPGRLSFFFGLPEHEI